MFPSGEGDTFPLFLDLHLVHQDLLKNNTDLAILGSSPQLGCWLINNAIKLDKSRVCLVQELIHKN